jgi:hypothetical protein
VWLEELEDVEEKRKDNAETLSAQRKRRDEDELIEKAPHPPTNGRWGVKARLWIRDSLSQNSC